MMGDWYLYPLLVLAGFAAGFINTLAGSGSIITLPLFMYLGLPANIANATNRINIIFQNATSTATFHRTQLLNWRVALALSIPAITGSIIGAMIAVSLDEVLMRTVIGGAMVMMAILILIKPNRWFGGHQTGEISRIKWWHLVLMFFLGIYAGFIQLGVGVFILTALVMGIGYDSKNANAIKVVMILAMNLVAIIIFQGSSQINWVLGLIVAIGSILGAWVAARYAIHWNPKWIYRLLIVIVIVTALDLFGVIKLLAGLLRNIP